MNNNRENENSKQVKIGSNISLNGLVTAVFDNMVHVQVGAKIIPIPLKELSTGLTK